MKRGSAQVQQILIIYVQPGKRHKQHLLSLSLLQRQSFCDDRTDTPTPGFPSHSHMHAQTRTHTVFCKASSSSWCFCNRKQSDLSFSQSVFYWRSTHISTLTYYKKGILLLKKNLLILSKPPAH